MHDFFHSLKFKIIVCVLALLIGFMLYAATQTGKEPGTSFIETLLSPIQSVSAAISEKVSSSLDMLTNARQYYEDNEKLKEQLSALYTQVIDYDDLKRENEELRKILGLKDQSPDFEFSPPCAVISRTANDPFASFVIDKGSDDDIAVNDPVITSEGLVGIVSKVSKTYSRVSTILSPDVAVGVYCIRTKDTGLVEGSIVAADDGKCEMKYISRESAIEPGDVIVSSGSSGIFPANQIIGTVEEIYMEDSGLSLTAVIQPIVDVRAVSNIFVITHFNGQGEDYAE